MMNQQETFNWLLSEKARLESELTRARDRITALHRLALQSIADTPGADGLGPYESPEKAWHGLFVWMTEQLARAREDTRRLDKILRECREELLRISSRTPKCTHDVECQHSHNLDFIVAEIDAAMRESVPEGGKP